MLYELIPAMPEVRLLPLIKRFTTMLAELPVFADPSAQYENEGTRETRGTSADASCGAVPQRSAPKVTWRNNRIKVRLGA
jgi:hypothetical protein